MWSPDGVLYAGGEAGQIYEVTLAGEAREVATTGGSLLGLTLDGDGRIYACDCERLEVVRVDPRHGRGRGLLLARDDAAERVGLRRRRQPLRHRLRRHEGGRRARDPDRAGRRDRRLVRGRARATRTASASPPTAASCSSSSPTCPACRRSRSCEDGSAGEPRVVLELPRTVPDGIALDAAGTMYVACYRPDRILRIRPGGEVEVLADDWQGDRAERADQRGLRRARSRRARRDERRRDAAGLGPRRRFRPAAGAAAGAVSGRFDGRGVARHRRRPRHRPGHRRRPSWPRARASSPSTSCRPSRTSPGDRAARRRPVPTPGAARAMVAEAVGCWDGSTCW